MTQCHIRSSQTNCILLFFLYNNGKIKFRLFLFNPWLHLDKATNVCHTAGCVSAAADMLRFIDEKIDPCDDFYDFACGKFLSETTLTDEKVSVDTFSIARDIMQSQLLRLIDSPIEPDDLQYCSFIIYITESDYLMKLFFLDHFDLLKMFFHCAWIRLALKRLV